jgi:hypothetical protein
LWFVLAVIIVGATTWSTIILIQQKHAWKSYAKKKGLNFTPNKFFEPAILEGTVGDYGVSLFTAVEQQEDSRKNRQITVAQINANFSFLGGIGLGTQKMKPFLEALETIKKCKPKSGKFDNSHEIRAESTDIADIFFTEERVKILNEILNFPKANVLILLDQNEGIFRFETSNPFHDEKKIDALVTKMIARIEKLKPTEDEKSKAPAQKTQDKDS